MGFFRVHGKKQGLGDLVEIHVNRVHEVRLDLLRKSDIIASSKGCHDSVYLTFIEPQSVCSSGISGE